MVPGAGDRACIRARPPARVDAREVGQLEIRALCRIRFHRGLRRRAMALRGLPNLAIRPQSNLRANYFAFFDPANLLYNPYHFAPLDKTPPPSHTE